MSINKVLNRPIFRNVALKKGHLKTINANTGVMVGSPYGGAPVPAIRKPPTFMERMKVSGPVRMGKNLIGSAANIPAYYGFTGGMKVGEALGINDPVGQTVSGLGGAYAASRALPALAGIGFLPSAVGIAAIEGVRNRVNAGIELRKKINAMSPAERKAFEIENRNKAFSYMGEGVTDQELFGKFVPKPPIPIDTKKSAAPKEGPGSGRVTGNKSKELKAEGDPLLQDNVANSDDIANLDSVQENSLGGGTPPGNEDGITNYTSTLEEDKERRKAEELLTASEKNNIKKNNEAAGNNEIALGGPSTDRDFNKTIALAKQYEEAVYKGEGSQANLVFLANLASGLLTGTTKRKGIGGALEVFGQSIGPAVNNYATIKLKEGELRQNRRAKSLEAAMDHMKFLNDAARVERPDVTPGVVQIRGANGDLQNYNGYIGKDGTTYLPGGLAKDGRQSLSPIAQGGVLRDAGPDGVLGTEDDISLGRFEKFLKQDKISSRLNDIEDTLGNRYTAYSVTLDILDTIKQTDAEGNLVSPGVALTLDTYLRRIGNAASDLVGRDIVAENLNVAENTLQTFYEDEVAIINKDPDLSEKEKENAIAMIDKDKLKKQILKDKKGVGWFSGLSAKDQEKLAVQETSLVYALANTFKDQDRLTQRDINAAREIVNLFAIGRGGQDVRDSIEAIAGQLRADIRRQELLYTSSGGLYSTIQDLKELEGYDSSKAQEKVEQAFGLTKEQIKNELDKMELK